MPEHRVSYVISILSPDRLGIVADAAGIVRDLGGNVLAASQTIMQGWFTMLVTATFPAGTARECVEEALASLGDFHVFVSQADGGGREKAPNGEPFIMTAVGADRPGIVWRLSQCCADKRVNIDDVWNEVRDGRFIIIFHLTVPRDVDPKDFRYDLERAAQDLGVALTMQHQDIFTATNSLQVHAQRRGRGEQERP